MIYRIRNRTSDSYYDAGIEVEGSSIILHSRGGGTAGRPARNPDYEQALITIIRRLRTDERVTGPTIKRVLLDSEPARERPVADRILISAPEIDTVSDDKLVTLVRKRARVWGQQPGTTGGNSTKQLRIETRKRSHHSILATLQLRKWLPRDDANKARPAGIERLPRAVQRQVTNEHIDHAIARLVAGDDTPNFPDSVFYDVVTPEGIRLPPKKVFGFALEEALGIEAFPGHFSAGWDEPSFELIQAAGYRIVSKDVQIVPETEVNSEFSTLPATIEDRIYIEGDKRMASHLRSERRRDARAGRDKRAQVIRIHGRLICERCGEDYINRFGREVASGCFEIHHTVPLSSLHEACETCLADLQCLCATCHRATHREMASGLPATPASTI
jgi:hypothetical protein